MKRARSASDDWLRRLRRMVGMVCAAAASQAMAADPFFLPARAGQVVQESYFGTHIHNLVLRGRTQDPPQATPFPEGQVGSIRLWDTATRWAEVQPEKNRWALERLDKYVAEARRQGATVLLTLGSTPR